MRLDRVQIKNYRSIKDITISFQPTCRVLAGINESGKSNILRALSLLADDIKPDKINDKREELPNEKVIEESLVSFCFDLEEELLELYQKVEEQLLTVKANPKVAIKQRKEIALRSVCSNYLEGLYEVNVLKEEKRYLYWGKEDEFSLIDSWRKIKNTVPKGTVYSSNEGDYELSNFRLVRMEDFEDFPEEYTENATYQDLQNIIGLAINGLIKDNKPEAILWEYKEDNLLPNEIDIDEFASDPDVCQPLKNMFLLAGYEDVEEALEEARTGKSENQFQNFLDRIASATTAHFRDVWKEYKSIEFSLRSNSGKILPGIREKNVHDFARRSDGFKRFVTFLLMISVYEKTKNLTNTLLLIDEPDISLHPSGARYLRDELIRIAQTNYVVYSTHSIFMIDSENIERHYIVKKKDEVTKIEEAGESNIKDEEVVYNALGFSMFEILKGKNIIFEGWRDKRLFHLAVEKTRYSSALEKIGFCHAKGVKTIRTITPVMQLTNRDCLIISDSDKPAKEEQKRYRTDKGHGEWKTYQELDATIQAINAEDFLHNEYIISIMNKLSREEGLGKFEEDSLPEKQNKLHHIQKWLASLGKDGEQVKDLLNKAKERLFNELQAKNIDMEEYSKLIKGTLSSLQLT